MNVEIGTEAAQFPEKEYINGIFVAVRYSSTVTLAQFSSRYHQLIHIQSHYDTAILRGSVMTSFCIGLCIPLDFAFSFKRSYVFVMLPLMKAQPRRHQNTANLLESAKLRAARLQNITNFRSISIAPSEKASKKIRNSQWIKVLSANTPFRLL
jgi:hypothetical protein